MYMHQINDLFVYPIHAVDAYFFTARQDPNEFRSQFKSVCPKLYNIDDAWDQNIIASVSDNVEDKYEYNTNSYKVCVDVVAVACFIINSYNFCL